MNLKLLQSTWRAVVFLSWSYLITYDGKLLL